MKARQQRIKISLLDRLEAEKITGGGTFAFIEDGKIFSQVFGVTNDNHSQPVKSDTQFQAASLSKPVFAYLVMKLIAKAKEPKDIFPTLPNSISEFTLDTPLYKILPELESCGEDAKLLTARLVLSHQTGMSNSQDSGPPKFLFKPGTEFGYAGYPYFYLQVAIERLTNKSLEELAQEFIFEPLKMTHSTFLIKDFQPKVKPNIHAFISDIENHPSCSANSLRTTAEDYAKFMFEVMNNPLHLFQHQQSMTKDQWAKEVGVTKELLRSIKEGVGCFLQTNEQGQIEFAFHYGDMGRDGKDWRAFVVMDVNKKKGAVFFTNVMDGLALSDLVFSELPNAKPAFQYVSEKCGFAVKFEPHWKEKQEARFKKIGAYLSSKQEATISDYEMSKSVFGKSTFFNRDANTASQIPKAPIIPKPPQNK